MMTQPTATVPCTLFVSVQRMHLNHTAEKKYIVAAIIKHLFSALKKMTWWWKSLWQSFPFVSYPCKGHAASYV